MKYSICIPAYKANFLRDCIKSVLSQTYADFELIILNDGSPENLRDIVEEYNDSRVRYYENERNVGGVDVVHNWNKCLEFAIGEYIICMGDDDMLTANCLEIYNELIDKYPQCDVYHCRSLIIDEDSQPLELTNVRPEFESVYDSITERINGRIFFIGDYLYRTDSLKKSGGFVYLPLAWGSDDLSSYMAARENGIAHTNDVLFWYRRNRFTISSKGSVDHKMKAILDQHKWLVDFLEEEPNGEIEKILWKTLKYNLYLYIQRTKIRTIYTSLAEGSSNIFYWIKVRNINNMSLAELGYAFLLSIKEKVKE
jgi:glycosyltransferase involved in cell wall biosynthesis